MLKISKKKMPRKWEVRHENTQGDCHFKQITNLVYENESLGENITGY